MLEIDPAKLYPLAEACLLVPSIYAGRHVDIETLHRWRRRGQLACQERKSGARSYWFCWGADLLRAMGAEEKPAPIRSPARRRADQAKLEKELRELGLKI